MVAVDDAVVVAVKVWVLVPVVVVVAVVVAVDVWVLVAVDVGEVVVVAELVGDVVLVLVTVVVGVVTAHSVKTPPWYAAVAAFSVAAVASQSELSNKNMPNAQPTVSFAPSGPRYSLSRAFIAAAVSGHELVFVSTTTPLVSMDAAPQLTWPVGVGQVAKARLSMSTWALQLKRLRIASSLGSAPLAEKRTLERGRGRACGRACAVCSGTGRRGRCRCCGGLGCGSA